MDSKTIDLKSLVDRGLTEAEAEQFYSLLEKVKPTAEDEAAFDHECDEAIPFEGGAGFTEALTGLKRAMES